MVKGPDVLPIELALPGDSRYMRLARLMASGVASTYGLHLDAIDGFRTAVDEMCATLIEVSAGQLIRLVFRVDGDVLVVTGKANVGDGGGPDQERLALSHQILDVLTEMHEFTRADGKATFTITIPLRG
jgi:hypothetical protein